MKNKRFLLIALLFSYAWAMQLFVPIGNPVYYFLERQATRGYIPEFLNDTQPIQRDEIVIWLVKLLEIENELPRVEREILYDFIVEYRHELSEQKHPVLGEGEDSRLGLSSWKNLKHDVKCIFTDELCEEEKHIYLFEDEKTTIWLDMDLMTRIEGKNSTMRFMDQLGAYAAIQTGDHVAMFVDGYFFHQYLPDGWTDPVDEFKGYWFAAGGDFDRIATFDRSEAYANFTGDFGTVSIAQYPHNWGNGLNSVVLSDNATTFGSLSWSKRFKHFKYSVLHGPLMTPTYSSMNDDGRYYIPKYIAAHRLEILFSPRFHVNFSELVMYGGEDRFPELTYLVPMIFLWPSEHALGDRDNKMISLEAELFPINGLRLYGTVFLDELVFGQIFNDFWANKYALQGGLQISPRSIPADLIFEATAVHPWTYTHHFIFANYTHHGRELGFYAGPNTQYINAQLNYDLSLRHRLTLTTGYLIEGADSIMVDDTMYPIGGDSNQDDYDKSWDLDYSTKWLMGDMTKTFSARLDWLYRWRDAISFLASCEYSRTNGINDLYYSLQINLNY